jgi:hypothetical protein
MSLETQVDAAHPAETLRLRPDQKPRTVGTQPVNPSVQPHLELVRVEANPEVDGMCPFVVETVGLPAVSRDGRVIVSAGVHIEGNADVSEEIMEVSWQRVGDDALIDAWEVYDRSDHPGVERDPPLDCSRRIARAKARVRSINERLAADPLRALVAIDVPVHDPDSVEAFVADIEAPPSGDPSGQMIEAHVHRGTFALRRRGIEVVFRQPRPDWQGSDDFCDRTPHLDRLWSDPATGASLWTYDHVSGGCLCSDHTYRSTMAIPIDVVARLLRDRETDASREA